MSGKCSASVPAQVKYVVIVDSMSLRQFGKFQSKRPRHFSTNGGEKPSCFRQLHTGSHTKRRKDSQKFLLERVREESSKPCQHFGFFPELLNPLSRPEEREVVEVQVRPHL